MGKDDERDEITGIDQMFFLDRALVTSFCQDKCPVALNCHGYISLISEGKFEDAHKMIRQRLTRRIQFCMFMKSPIR